MKHLLILKVRFMIHKMAIVCSSSKAGDSFKGAVNSTLFVDELEIIGE